MLDWDTVVWVRRWANKFNLRIQFSLTFFVGRCVMHGIEIATTNRQMNFVEIVSGEIILSWNLDNFMRKRVLYYIQWFTPNRNVVTSTQWSTDKDFRWNYTCTLFLGVWDWFGACLVQLLSCWVFFHAEPCRFGHRDLCSIFLFILYCECFWSFSRTIFCWRDYIINVIGTRCSLNVN